MRHLADGVLRRLYDEPLALGAQDRTHLAGCARCHARYQTITADARAVGGLLDEPAEPDLRAALATFRGRMATAQREAAMQGRGLAPHIPRAEHVAAGPPSSFSHIRRFLMIMHARYRRLPNPARGVTLAATLAAALLAAVALTPAGSLAQGLLTIFEPRQFAAVPVTMADLQSLPDLQQYGTVHAPSMPAPRTFPSAASAGAAAGEGVLTLDAARSGVSGRAHYGLIGATTGSFTFSAARARAAAHGTGKALPPMPASLDGSVLQVTVGPVVVTTYGAAADTHDTQALLIAQAPLPRVTSTGATVSAIERYLLALPGVSPSLASAIRSIGDPATTLPIPIPIDLAQADHVTVQGVTGLAVGDNTGIGSGVIWQKDGMVYGVAGAMPESRVLAIARALR